jgi:hypothetical protein
MQPRASKTWTDAYSSSCTSATQRRRSDKRVNGFPKDRAAQCQTNLNKHYAFQLHKRNEEEKKRLGSE